MLPLGVCCPRRPYHHSNAPNRQPCCSTAPKSSFPEKKGLKTAKGNITQYSCIVICTSSTTTTYLLTYLLTPWCKVLLEKLTGLQLVKKFPTFHGTRRFITALKSVRQMCLFWANPIQSIYQHLTSWKSILILTTHLRLVFPSGLFPSGFPHQEPIQPPLLTYTRHMPSPSHFSRFYHSQNIR